MLSAGYSVKLIFFTTNQTRSHYQIDRSNYINLFQYFQHKAKRDGDILVIDDFAKVFRTRTKWGANLCLIGLFGIRYSREEGRGT